MTKKSSSGIIVIGAALLDIMGFPEQELINYDSVPGKIELIPGGVGRNIAENLALLSLPVNLVTAFGDDPFSHLMIQHARVQGLDISNSLFLKDINPGLHLAGMDQHNDMAFGIADLDIFKELSPENLKHLLPSIDDSSYCILETNVPKNTIHWLLEECKNTSFILDPVSAPMSKKVEGVLDKIDILCPNIIEAESLTGIKLDSKESIKKAGNWFISQGLQQVFITMGKEGVFCQNHHKSGWIQAPPISVVNTMGAGDAFLAGLVFGLHDNLPIEDSTLMGVAGATIALEDTSPVNPKISKELLIQRFEALKTQTLTDLD